MSSVSGISGGAGSTGSSGSSVAAEIASLTRQIQRVTQQLKEISSSDGLTDEQKIKQAEIMQDQIVMLQAQITALQQKQAEAEAEKAAPVKAVSEASSSNDKPADGVNRPTKANPLNLYI